MQDLSIEFIDDIFPGVSFCRESSLFVKKIELTKLQWYIEQFSVSYFNYRVVIILFVDRLCDKSMLMWLAKLITYNITSTYIVVANDIYTSR